jgi:hypothetical protein
VSRASANVVAAAVEPTAEPTGIEAPRTVVVAVPTAASRESMPAIVPRALETGAAPSAQPSPDDPGPPADAPSEATATLPSTATVPPSATLPPATPTVVTTPSAPSPAPTLVTATIAGQVTDEGGTPLPGALVSAELLPDRWRVWTTVADEAGEFRLSLPSGGYTVRAEHEGYRVHWYGGRTHPAEAEKLLLHEGESREGVHLRLRPLWTPPTPLPSASPAPLPTASATASQAGDGEIG